MKCCVALFRSKTDWSQYGGPAMATLAAFYFFHWFKPSEPFLVPILESSYGISTETIYTKLYPWSSYALLPCSLLVGAVYEWFGIVPGLLLVALADVMTTVFVIASNGSIEWLIASYFMFAVSFGAMFLGTATVFALVPENMYAAGSSLSRSSMLLGTIVSSVVGQILVSSKGLSKFDTLWLSVGGTSASLIALLAGVYWGVYQPTRPRFPITTMLDMRLGSNRRRGGYTPGNQSFMCPMGADRSRSVPSLSGRGDSTTAQQTCESRDERRRRLLSGDPPLSIYGCQSDVSLLNMQHAAAPCLAPPTYRQVKKHTTFEGHSCRAPDARYTVPVSVCDENENGALVGADVMTRDDSIALCTGATNTIAPATSSPNSARCGTGVITDRRPSEYHVCRATTGTYAGLSCQDAASLGAQLLVAYTDGGVLLWSILQAGLRAAHTLVLTYWQALLAGIEQDEAANGAVYAGAYLLAAVAVCIPAVPCIQEMARHHWPEVMAVGSAMSAGTLLLMSLSSSRAIASVLFVLFHASAEALLVIAAVSIGRRLSLLHQHQPFPRAEGNACDATYGGSGDDRQAQPELEESKAQDSVFGIPHAQRIAWDEDGSTNTDSATTDSATTDSATTGSATTDSATTEHESSPFVGSGEDVRMLPSATLSGPTRTGHPCFAAVLSCNALVGMLAQLALQSAVGDGGLQLDLRRQFTVFAGFQLIVAWGAASCMLFSGLQ